MKKSVLYLAAGLSAWASAAVAQDQVFDARSIGMGGTGVAISNTRNAALMNPAALATMKDNFAWEIPIIGVRVLDENSLASDLDTLTTDADNLTLALQNFYNDYNASSPNTSTSAASAATALSNFDSSLNQVSNKSLSAGGYVGTMLGIPSSTAAVALTLDGRVELGGQFNYAAADSATITTLATNLAGCSSGTAAACTAASGSVGADGSVTGLQSQLLVRGVVAKELGITVAHHFEEMGGIDVGVTPKLSKLTSYDVALDAQSGDSISTNYGSASKREESVFNIDLGVMYSLMKAEDYEIQSGLIVKDMLSRTLKTVLNNDITIQPRATVGVGYLSELVSAGVDLDITSNKPMIAGFGSDSQFLRLGAEFDAWSWAQLRLGYRHDLKGNYKGLPSIGLGLSPFGVHFDLSVAKTGENEAAAALQFGLNF